MATQRFVDLAERIWRLGEDGRRVLVAVDGPSGSGKSTFAARLAVALDAPVVPMDDFVSWDDFDGWWARLEEQVLAPYLADRPVTYQRRDWGRDPLGAGLGEWRALLPARGLILEGVTSSRRKVADRLTFAVWIEAPRRFVCAVAWSATASRCEVGGSRGWTGRTLFSMRTAPGTAPTSWSTETIRRACPETITRPPSVSRDASRPTSGHAGGVTGLPVVVDYRPDWPTRAAALLEQLRRELGSSIKRIEHIGSTAIPGMAAKDVLDLQASVTDLTRAAETFDGPLRLLGFRRSPYEHDHVPAGSRDDQSRWAKRLWVRRGSPEGDVNLHVRLVGFPNERLALLFRDWFRAHPEAVPAYASFKRSLAAISPDVGTYAEVKDPVVDLVLVVAETWATKTGWSLSAPLCGGPR